MVKHGEIEFALLVSVLIKQQRLLSSMLRPKDGGRLSISTGPAHLLAKTMACKVSLMLFLLTLMVKLLSSATLPVLT
jgi:hypothetical protein